VHDLFRLQEPHQALEYMGFVSLLHRQLDSALNRPGESGDFSP
jgi:hypothetical protein